MTGNQSLIMTVHNVHTLVHTTASAQVSMLVAACPISYTTSGYQYFSAIRKYETMYIRKSQDEAHDGIEGIITRILSQRGSTRYHTGRAKGAEVDLLYVRHQESAVKDLRW